MRAARRAEEREHYRLLHDSVSATLTVVAAGGLDGQLAGAAPPGRPGPARWSSGCTSPDRRGRPTWPAGCDPVLARPGRSASPRRRRGATGAGRGRRRAGRRADRGADQRGPARRAGPGPGARRRPADGGGVTVEVADDGAGFDPAAVPASRRGVRESLVGRMRAVRRRRRRGARWPRVRAAAGDPGAARAGPAGRSGRRADDPAGRRRPAGLGEVIAARYRRGFDLAVIWLVGAWHVGNDLLATGDQRGDVPVDGGASAGLAGPGRGPRGRRATGCCGTADRPGRGLAAGRRRAGGQRGRHRRGTRPRRCSARPTGPGGRPAGSACWCCCAGRRSSWSLPAGQLGGRPGRARRRRACWTGSGWPASRRWSTAPPRCS